MAKRQTHARIHEEARDLAVEQMEAFARQYAKDNRERYVERGVIDLTANQYSAFLIGLGRRSLYLIDLKGMGSMPDGFEIKGPEGVLVPAKVSMLTDYMCVENDFYRTGPLPMLRRAFAVEDYGVRIPYDLNDFSAMGAREHDVLLPPEYVIGGPGPLNMYPFMASVLRGGAMSGTEVFHSHPQAIVAENGFFK